MNEIRLTFICAKRCGCKHLLERLLERSGKFYTKNFVNQQSTAKYSFGISVQSLNNKYIVVVSFLGGSDVIRSDSDLVTSILRLRAFSSFKVGH